MCDYSLHGIPNRLAQKDEVLVVYRFDTGSKGLTSPNYLNLVPRPALTAALESKYIGSEPQIRAVCIPDGTKLAIDGMSEMLQSIYGFHPTETVIFRQLSVDSQTYRDAMEFTNGVRLSLQDLQEGQHVKVFSLGSVEAVEQRGIESRSRDSVFTRGFPVVPFAGRSFS